MVPIDPAIFGILCAAGGDRVSVAVNVSTWPITVKVSRAALIIAAVCWSEL